MGKFIKYEIKSNYRFILGIIAVIIIASTVFQVSFKNEMENTSIRIEPSNDVFLESSTGIRSFFLIISILAIFSVFFVAFFKIVGSFKDELSEDSGYLTFTLPLRGSQIVGGKLIVASLWYLILGLTIIFYNLILIRVLYKVNPLAMNIVRDILTEGRSAIKAMLLLGILSSISTTLIIYLSMAIGKVGFKNNRLGGLWFIIFILISTTVNYFVYRISSGSSMFLSVDGLGIKTSLNNVLSPALDIVSLKVIDGKFFINIGYLISTIGVILASFLGSSYIIENKIDL